jgi:type IX secretion system PorP/SprF family membrane protein
MNNMKKFYLYLSFVMLLQTADAQSYHFSQFFSTPLLTNPANTGYTNGALRVASNMRSQGAGGSTLFTGYLSADLSMLRNKLTLGHKAGVGAYVMNDQSLTGAVRTNSMGLSAAYHVGFDEYGEHSFGIGVQATFNQRRLDYSKLSFENQYGPNGYDPSLPVGEPLNFSKTEFFDLNVGGVYNVSLPDRAFFAGFSVYNILQHRENLLAEEFKMPTRFTLQAGAQLSVGGSGSVYASMTAMSQAKATEVTLGSAFGLQLSETDKNEIMGGLWYRFKDAVIPYIGYQHSSFQVGLSYDYTVSSLKAGSQTRNAYELTLQFKSPDDRELKTLIPWY